MKYTYTEVLHPIAGKVCSVTRSDGASIPLDPANSDYQAYLNKDTLASESANDPAGNK